MLRAFLLLFALSYTPSYTLTGASILNSVDVFALSGLSADTGSSCWVKGPGTQSCQAADEQIWGPHRSWAMGYGEAAGGWGSAALWNAQSLAGVGLVLMTLRCTANDTITIFLPSSDSGILRVSFYRSPYAMLTLCGELQHGESCDIPFASGQPFDFDFDLFARFTSSSTGAPFQSARARIESLAVLAPDGSFLDGYEYRAESGHAYPFAGALLADVAEPMPEPATTLVLGISLIALAGLSWRNRRIEK
jgi:hypothetical protein